MKLQLISDVHIEFWRDLTKAQKEYKLYSFLDLDPEIDVLVIAGDLNTGRENTLETLRLLAPMYNDIIYLPGNHEYYHGLEIDDFDTAKSNFKFSLPDNVHYLNPGVEFINDVQFIGCTLWTDFHNNPIAEKLSNHYISDFRRMKTTTTEMKRVNAEHKEYLKSRYGAFKQYKKVFVTHFLPAMECVSERYRKHDVVTNHLNRYFANDMDDWIATLENATWLFGHTHDYVDVTIGQTRCLAAPVGYPDERPEPYKPLVIEV